MRPPTIFPAKSFKTPFKVSRIRAVLHFVAAAWTISALLLLLAFRAPARFRDWAVAASDNRWVQCLIFLPLFVFTLRVVTLPVHAYRHYVSESYGLSIQSWSEWLWDQTKESLILVGMLYLPVMLLFFLLRRLPRRWWLWFWAGSVPFVVFTVFISPVILDPLMNDFAPLQQSNPALTARLQQIVARGGLSIVPDRMFLMKASAKTTQLNAYVTGIGAWKRVVVWDTSIAKATPDEISFIFGHEMGHYVLNHIWLGVAFASAESLLLLWLGFHAVNWGVRRFGRAWGVPSTHDWAALGVLALAVSIFSFFVEPVDNAFSRWCEHQADIYGQEAIHGIAADPRAAARDAFQVLGETSLVDPNPNRFVEFWTGSHPAIASRAAFVQAYDPWQPGQRPKYFRK
jgi:STE24 endopeptidase